MSNLADSLQRDFSKVLFLIRLEIKGAGVIKGKIQAVKSLLSCQEVSVLGGAMPHEKGVDYNGCEHTMLIVKAYRRDKGNVEQIIKAGEMLGLVLRYHVYRIEDEEMAS